MQIDPDFMDNFFHFYCLHLVWVYILPRFKCITRLMCFSYWCIISGLPFTIRVLYATPVYIIFMTTSPKFTTSATQSVQPVIKPQLQAGYKQNNLKPIQKLPPPPSVHQRTSSQDAKVGFFSCNSDLTTSIVHLLVSQSVSQWSKPQIIIQSFITLQS